MENRSIEATELSPRMLSAVIYLGSVSIAFFLSLPVFVELMARQWHFDESHSGFVVAIGVIGTTLGAFLMSFAFQGISQKLKLMAAVFLMMLGYAVAATASEINQVTAGVVLSGFGCGAVNGLSSQLLTYSSRPHRNLAAQTLVQNLLSFVLMSLALPSIGEHWQASGGFWLMAVLCLPCLLIVSGLPVVREWAVESTEGTFNPLGVTGLLASIFTFYIVIGVVWTFVGSMGLEHGYKAAAVDRIVGVGNLVSLAVCIWAPKLEKSSRLLAWSILSALLTAAGTWVIAKGSTFTLFTVGIIVMTGAWTLNSIIVQCLFPRVDPSARFVGVMPGLMGVGYSVGSFAGGTYIAEAGASSCFMYAALLGAVSAVFLVVVRRRGPQAVDTVFAPQEEPRNQASNA